MNRGRDVLLVALSAVTVVLLAIIATMPRPVERAEPAFAPMLAAHEKPRSGKWPKVEKAFIAEHPECAVCGHKGTKDNPLNVHHRLPFHKFPQLELDPENLIVLCRVHHEWWGHLGEWKSWNVDVAKDAKIWRKKIENRP